MEKQSLYDQQVFEETLKRIDNLTPETKPQWGKMDAAQMLAHCAEVIDVSNGKPLKNTPFLVTLLKGPIKKAVVGPKPYPKNSKTHPQYRQTEPKNFEEEKGRLLNSLDKMKELEGKKIYHSLFGVMSQEDKGWAMYKHLDHHLQQFGV
jgi:hypothetical protein